MRKLSVPTYAGIIVAILLAAATAVYFVDHKERGHPKRVKTMVLGDALGRISIATTNVSKHLRPVLLYKEVNGELFPHSVGAQLDGDKTIITCAHSFWEDGSTTSFNPGPWNFYFVRLQPFSDEIEPISQLQEFPGTDSNTLVDAVMCIPGRTTPIHSLPKPSKITGRYQTKSYHVSKSPETVHSTLTGASAHIVGDIRTVSGLTGYIMDRSNKDLESGSVWVDAKEKTLYIPSITIRRSETSESMFKLFKLTDDKKEISLCSSLEMH